MPGRHYKLLAVVALACAVLVAAVIWLGGSKPLPVVVATVGRGPVQSTVSNTRAGTIKACRRAGISPSIGGQIASLPVREGDAVERGQLLMELWNEDQQAQLALATSQARTAEAEAEQACIKSEVARREADRLKQLRKQKLVSEESADKADGDARAQQAACNAARATRQVSRARIQVVQAELARTRLTAPFAGIVAEVNGEIGEFVTPSPVGIPTPPAVDLVDTSCLYASAPIDEVDAPQIRVGMPVRVSLDAMAGQTFAGEVRRIAPYVLEFEKQARTVDVEADFACPQQCQGMLPGYSADIEVILEQHADALRVPTEAVLEGNRVLVVGSDERLEARSIGTGLSNWIWTEVSDGLSAGDRVVVSVERQGVEAGAAVVAQAQPSDD